MNRVYMVSVGLVLFMSLCVSQTTRRVPQDYATIQAAIDASANGDTVLVAEGIYVENLRVTKKITLASLYLTDGDTSHISKTIIDGSNPSNADTASVVTIGPGTDTTTVVAGFTITNGGGTKMYYVFKYYRFGGGINVVAGGATIRHNRIVRNILHGTLSDWEVCGAGINIISTVGPISSWIIRENDIVNNQARGSWSSGGGCYVMGDGTITGNRFVSNTSMSVAISGVTE